MVSCKDVRSSSDIKALLQSTFALSSRTASKKGKIPIIGIPGNPLYLLVTYLKLQFNFSEFSELPWFVYMIQVELPNLETVHILTYF